MSPPTFSREDGQRLTSFLPPPPFGASIFVATVEHGVPLMRSKWVHRTWAHQEGTQGQGTRLADGPPICPMASRGTRHRQPRQRTGGPSGAPSTRKKTRRSRGPRRPVGGQAQPRERTSTRAKRMSLPAPAGSSQNTWVPRRWWRQGGQGQKICQSLSALSGKGGRPHLTPLRRILG